jgi:dTMP kinase
VFITFEGTEGSGKTANVAWLKEWFEERHFRVVAAREPGGTALGEQIRSLLLQPSSAPTGYASLLLFEAARAELVAHVLRPALEGGDVVICDRFTDSSLAYQGYGEGLPLEQVRRANELATQGLKPDLTILLDLDAEEGLRRRQQSAEWNAIDDRPLAFHRAVRDGFLALAAAEPSRWLVVDAARPLEGVRSRIETRLLALPALQIEKER